MELYILPKILNIKNIIFRYKSFKFKKKKLLGPKKGVSVKINSKNKMVI